MSRYSPEEFVRSPRAALSRFLIAFKIAARATTNGRTEFPGNPSVGTVVQTIISLIQM
jgi:hypothetical protein